MLNETLIILALTAWLTISLMYPYKYAGKTKKSYARQLAAMLLLSPLLGFVVIKLFLQEKKVA